ncbi:MAG: flap endonuclease-1 [Candidatus Aenigmatarchaeota archaeon]
MGVQIFDILPKKELEIGDLRGRVLAVDAFLWLHQFLSIIRQPDGTPLMDSKGSVTSHLSGIFYRTAKLVENGVKMVFVFDGPSHNLKTATVQERKDRKEQAKVKWQEALDHEDMEGARKAAQMTSHLTGAMIEQSKNLLEYMGIPVIQAPSEGEAQCAHLCRKGLVYAVSSQDSDSLLFNSPKLIRNISVTGRRKLPRQDTYVEIKPELIELDSVLKALGVTREQLIVAGMLVGSDYNPGIKGYGPKKAIELVKSEKTLENVLKKIEWKYDVPAEKIYDFYLNPVVDDRANFEFKSPQPDKIIKFMVDEHEFSLERVEKIIKVLTESKESNQQKSLGSWIK